jgi:AcrR family transcriptional regulator
MAKAATVRSAKPAARLAKGASTRESILRAAVDIASVEGLEGLTIGRLAEELKMSKSGLFAHFGSKEDLQLATVAMAREIFKEHVVRPALEGPSGAPRLWNLCDGWLRYAEGDVFKGGCFFTAASYEFDSRSGPVRDSIASAMKEWMKVLIGAVELAKKQKHLRPDVDAEQFAFEVYSLAMGSRWSQQLLDDKKSRSRVRKTIAARIRALATPECPPIKLPA